MATKTQEALTSTTFPEDLPTLRQWIDTVDDRIIELLNRRARLAQNVGAVKAKLAERMYVPERERQLLTRLVQKSQGPLPEESLRLIYKEIISASLALESPLEVAYVGPEATFTHEASKRHFGMSARARACRTIADVFADVEKGRAEYGVVPLESSSEGVVSHTLDMFATSSLQICAEVLLEAYHHLLTRSGELQGITKVYVHADALLQCRTWLEGNLPHAQIVDVASTARAAQLASEDANTAAVGNDLSASLFNLQIAASALEDTSSVLNRYLVIGKERRAPTGSDRTSVMFALKQEEPGILFKTLEPFARAQVNLSRIESRPWGRLGWDYMFFVDLDGHRDEPVLAGCLKTVESTCVFFKILGSYPQDPRVGGGLGARRARLDAE